MSSSLCNSSPCMCTCQLSCCTTVWSLALWGSCMVRKLGSPTRMPDRAAGHESHSTSQTAKRRTRSYKTEVTPWWVNADTGHSGDMDCNHHRCVHTLDPSCLKPSTMLVSILPMEDHRTCCQIFNHFNLSVCFSQDLLTSTRAETKFCKTFIQLWLEIQFFYNFGLEYYFRLPSVFV